MDRLAGGPALAVGTETRSAPHHQTTRPGQSENTMDSALRPRDIQARIRAGETPEAVAQLAQASVERIMAYAGPVLAEREHIAQRAQGSSLRRRTGDEARGARTLGEAVEAHLRRQNTDPGLVEWDAWRREDGRWTLTGRYATTRREGVATFTFDARGSFVTLEDDDARWLVGEEVPDAAAPGAAEPAAGRVRRLAAVPGAEVELGDDAIELVSDDPSPAAPTDPTGATPEEPGAAPGAAPSDVGPAPADPVPTTGAPAADEGQLELPTDGDEDAQPAAEETPTRRPVSKKRGRASVPSWDEIMFGGRDQ